MPEFAFHSLSFPFSAEASRLLQSVDAIAIVPQQWRGRLQSQLQSREEVVAVFEADLTNDLRYGLTLVAITSRRVIALSGPDAASNGRPGAPSPDVESWNLSDDMTLQNRDFATVGSLELLSPSRRLAVWRYTVGRTPAAHRFAQRFSAARAGQTGAVSVASVCPSCGGLIDPETGECPQCAVQPAPPPVSSLLRLVQFARPRAGMIALGFGLTVAGTAASLVPPYLTKPLIDDVLTPYAFGQPYDPNLIYWLLGGLGLAALTAWILDWAKTFVLAWVSERISADMRTRTYRHLQELSLEFFGGKRTGDLMSRVGSD
jgi:ATP-binding cassette subfamily B protein